MDPPPPLFSNLECLLAIKHGVEHGKRCVNTIGQHRGQKYPFPFMCCVNTSPILMRKIPSPPSFYPMATQEDGYLVLCCVVLCCVVLCCVVLCCVVLCCVVLCCVVLCCVVLCCVVLCCVVLCCVVLCCVVLCCVVLCCVKLCCVVLCCVVLCCVVLCCVVVSNGDMRR